ncbi:MAG: phosphoribosylamine--glycine ligase, partial [Firmicutes bacterium]|nr:phosphoribosylamine--glycine ligase [Bacillota bacterium]
MRILIVGKWSKELAVAKALAASGEARIISYAGGINPGMLKLGAEIVTGDEDDLDAVVSCSREKKADLVFVGTETALAAGAVDRLQGAGLAAIGPTALQARLESDKTFARSLLQEAGIPGNPEFRICRDRSQAARAIDEFDGRVAVKPGGLTEGLGVRISGDQLPTPGDALAYAEYVLAQGIGGLPYLIIEELLEGEEFTLQALVAGGELLPFPLVQDYKRLLEGDLGPNTGGMGSIAGRDGLLPFVDPGTREEALAIMRETVSELDRRCRTPYRGFLYGQFMITARGLRLIEYNVRPGDPEVLNCFAVMKGDLLEAFRCMAADSLAAAIEGLSFAPRASVCKFLVPSGYP